MSADPAPRIAVPAPGLVVLVGPTGAGKSTFARRHFKPTEVVSSDACRAMIADDETDQTVSGRAFEVFHGIIGHRLAVGRVAVADATNVAPDARKPLLALARQYHAVPIAIVFDLHEEVLLGRLQARTDRAFGPEVLHRHRDALARTAGDLGREGFWHVYRLTTPEAVDAAVVERVPLPSDRRDDPGPFDVVGDVHGCCDELEELLALLGYAATPSDDPLWGGPVYAHPAGRRAVFVGDLTDRGPRSLDVVRVVRNMVVRGSGLCVPGNHDDKLVRKLRGHNVTVSHGLAGTLAEVDALPEDVRGPFADAVAEFLDGLVSHYVFDGGRLVVAHGGMPADMQGRASKAVRDFALYGHTTGETDELGLPVRLDWALTYRGRAAVVYGHTPVPEPIWRYNTVNIDTGCAFGGKLTALRWPEREFVSVPARREYAAPRRPFLPPPRPRPPDPDDGFAAGILPPPAPTV